MENRTHHNVLVLFDSCSSGLHDEILSCVRATATSVSSVPPTVSLEFLHRWLSPLPACVQQQVGGTGSQLSPAFLPFCHLACSSQPTSTPSPSIGYPVVTLGFGFKSYVGYRMRQRRQKVNFPLLLLTPCSSWPSSFLILLSS